MVSRGVPARTSEVGKAAEEAVVVAVAVVVVVVAAVVVAAASLARHLSARQAPSEAHPNLI